MDSTERPRRLVGYVRVSTEDQAEDGCSLDAQQARIGAWCASQGATLVGTIRDEGISAKNLVDRPGVQAALAMVRARPREADGIVFMKLDRLCRCVRDALDLTEESQRYGWALVSVTESLDTSTPIGEFVVTIIAAVAQLERKMTGSRTREALAYLRTMGKQSGQLPYGWRLVPGTGRIEAHSGRMVGGDLEEDPRERAILGRILGWHAAGTPAGSIAASLNAEGIHARGQRWHRTTIRRILAAEEARCTKTP